MKKFTLLFSIVLLTLVSFNQVTFAQAQRLVLVEEFTQASCPPCASQNPGFNDLLSQNLSKARSIKYQVSWPGFDPMYLHNTSQVDSRVSYYGVNGVPFGLIDGSSITDDCGYYDGAPACLSQTDIDNAYAITSPFELTLTHSFSPTSDSIYVTLGITAAADVSGTIKARIAIVEQEIDFDSPPGTNGETVFENVMKQMLPSVTGTALPSTMSTGYTNTITQKWKLANIYDLNKIAVVAWIQNDGDKTIYQAAYSDPLPPLANYGNATINVEPPITCSGTVSPQADIINLGTSTMTSATINYAVGTGTYQTYQWSGNLTAGSTATNVPLPDVTISDPNGSYPLKGYISDINGTPFNSSILVSVASNVIVFGTASVPAPIAETFTNATFPPPGWILNGSNSTSNWIRVSNVGGYQTGLGSAKYDFYNIGEGSIGELYVTNFDLSNTSYSALSFDLAKCTLTGYNDELQVSASDDCGASWSVLYDLDDANGLGTYESASFTAWKPNNVNQWRTETVDLSSMSWKDNILVKFVAISGYGNNLFIDNINLTGNVGIENPAVNGISIYPNPANETAVVHVSGTLSTQTILEVVNVLGQVIYSTSAKSNSDITISSVNFETGMYVYRLNDNGKIIAQDKFNVSH